MKVFAKTIKVLECNIEGYSFDDYMISNTIRYGLRMNHPKYKSYFLVTARIGADAVEGSSLCWEGCVFFYFKNQRKLPRMGELVRWARIGRELLHELAKKDIYSKTDLDEDLILEPDAVDNFMALWKIYENPDHVLS